MDVPNGDSFVFVCSVTFDSCLPSPDDVTSEPLDDMVFVTLLACESDDEPVFVVRTDDDFDTLSPFEMVRVVTLDVWV